MWLRISSALERCASATRARNGSAWLSHSIGPMLFGTGTSKRGRCSVSTMRAATSSGSMNGIPRSPGNPEARSVWTSDGRTTDISTPVPRSSIATASEKPATPNFVAT